MIYNMCCIYDSYVIEEPPLNEGWGDRNETGHWEGLVGQLVKEVGNSSV